LEPVFSRSHAFDPRNSFLFLRDILAVGKFQLLPLVKVVAAARIFNYFACACWGVPQAQIHQQIFRAEIK
jgi:hypothetical protein